MNIYAMIFQMRFFQIYFFYENQQNYKKSEVIPV